MPKNETAPETETPETGNAKPSVIIPGKPGLSGLDPKAALVIAIDAKGATATIRTGTRGLDAPNVSEWPAGLVEVCDRAVKDAHGENARFFVADDGDSLRYTRKPDGLREV